MMLSYCLYGEIKYGETALTDERIQAVFSSLDDLDEGLTCADPRVRWQMVNLIIVRNWRYIKPYLEYCEENSKAAGGDLAAMLDALFDALFQISGKLLIQTAWFSDFHMRSRHDTADYICYTTFASLALLTVMKKPPEKAALKGN